jgi:hypothetical protein
LLASTFGFAAACDDDGPTDPTDETITFTAQLSPANEVPAVTNAESTGSGTATIVFDVDRDSAGTITAATANFQVNLTGFPAGTPLTMAHIHTGAAGVNGGILVDTGLVPNEVTLTTGAGNFTKNGIGNSGTNGLTVAEAQDIINNPAGFYFNVHSVLNPGGMARGQLVKQ